MAAVTKKEIEKVLTEFKTCLFIQAALEKCKVNHIDFFEFLEDNKTYSEKFEKINNWNNLILEDKVAQSCYNEGKNPRMLIEMIKANNKKKYIVKQEIEVTNNLKDLSDEELDKMIERLQNKT